MKLVLDSCIRQKAYATLNKQMSDYFMIENLVKQGDVISPIFFSINIDLVQEQGKSEYGCLLNSVYIGAFSYVDDISYILPSIGFGEI